ncbi:MAG: type I-U CRISPR-associated protein Csb2 [Burkholderiales bacterium]
MLGLEFTFPAGRYHATPWERHVNEGAVVWPPEPWRVLRALIATWHHKVKPAGRHDESTLAGLIDALSRALPEYALPAASHGHTRHYMPQLKPGDTSLVFDAFAAVGREEPLRMAWQQTQLSEPQLALVDDLLEAMGYLGRAESWVEARRFEGAFQANCRPGNEAVNQATGELSEIVTLLAPLPCTEYGVLRQRFLTDERARRKLGTTLPESLLDALSVTTPDLRKLGWNQPPASRKVNYLRPMDALKPQRRTHKAAVPTVTTVSYLLIGKPLPRVEDSLRIGELLRRAVMSEAKSRLGEDSIPPILSGHGLERDGRHRHAFFLPWDGNGDGRIDRLVLHVPNGLGLQERRIAEGLRRLWSHDGSEWRLVVEGIGGAEIGRSLLEAAMVWESVTPYLHPWHAKKRFGVEDQIGRECRERGLPEPVQFERLDCIRVGKQVRRPNRFHRYRGKRGLDQPDHHGSFWRLTFAKPVSGPLALGFACHFGLGLFAPRFVSQP